MTGDDINRGQMIEGLAHLLDVYGANRARWPARERLRYSGFVAEDPDARRMIAEAYALDRVLDMAPVPQPANLDDLTARIMASAGAYAEPARGGVVPLRPRTLPKSRTFNDSILGWPAAALLAASLVLGVFVGTSGVIDGPMQSIASISTSDTDSDDDGTRLAFGSDETANIEEDLL